MARLNFVQETVITPAGENRQGPARIGDTIIQVHVKNGKAVKQVTLVQRENMAMVVPGTTTYFK